MIEAVEMEETTKHPRIAISNKINEYLDSAQMYSYDNLEILTSIIWSHIKFKCADDVICISYLYCLDIRSFLADDLIKQLPKILQQVAPNDNHIQIPFPDVDRILKKHKTIVERKLMEHTIYTSFDTNSIKDFDIQESILRKYIWTMYYHNIMCKLYQKQQYHIETIANCESRHMKLTVFVVDENGKIKTDL